MSANTPPRGRERRSRAKADRLEFRLNADEKQAFQDAADLAGIPLSNWVRERLRRAAASELEAAGMRAAFLKNFRLD